MVLSLRRSCLVSHVILLIYALLATAVFCAASDNNQTYYEILGLAPNAKLRDIKKAYRRLAMEHHPDRNKGSEEEATLKFRQVSEAYEVLSDDKLRREYDMDLKSGRAGGSAGNGQQQRQQWRSSGGWAGHRPHRDPFAQFNDLFQNDPFFKDAFEGLDDLFAKTFQQGGPNSDGGRAFGRAATNEKQKQGGWGQRVANMMGGNVQFSFSSSTSTSTGNGRTRSYSSSSSSSRGGGSSYTSRSTRTEIINGRRITVQSLEKDGNRIEERYDGTKLVKRKVNGMKQRLEEIAGDDL